MRNYFLVLIAILAFNFNISAQETTSTEKKENKIKKTFESESKDRLFLVLNHDNLLHKETNGFKTQWYSRGIGAYFMWDFQIKKSRFSVAPGVGYNFAAYYHNGRMQEDSSGISFPTIVDLKNDNTYKRGRLAVHYIEVPIELRFRHMFKNTNMSLKLAVGIKGSVKVSTTAKEVRTGPNDYAKHYNTANFKDINTFRVGPTFRVGYGPFNLLAYYNLMPLFKKGKGPAMTPFSIGIAFTTL
ncbi:MAG: outer membrane beta-barrel protein [Chitinophagales bacterium]